MTEASTDLYLALPPLSQAWSCQHRDMMKPAAPRVDTADVVFHSALSFRSSDTQKHTED